MDFYRWNHTFNASALVWGQSSRCLPVPLSLTQQLLLVVYISLLTRSSPLSVAEQQPFPWRGTSRWLSFGPAMLSLGIMVPVLVAATVALPFTWNISRTQVPSLVFPPVWFLLVSPCLPSLLRPGQQFECSEMVALDKSQHFD